MKKISVIFNADDFGLTKSISDAVIEAHRRGVLTSATLMAGEEWAPYAAGLAARNPGLSVGVHFQLVAGKPVTRDLSKVRTLVDENGMFPPNFMAFFKKLHFGGVDMRQLRTELMNQVKKAAALGVKITHADSHQHLHMHPRVLAAVADVMREAGISRIRNPVEVYDRALHGRVAPTAGNAIKIAFMNPAYKWWYGRRLSAFGFRYPGVFFGQFCSGAMTEDRILGFAGRVEGIAARYPGDAVVCEIMTHPGAADEYNNIGICDAAFGKYRWREEFLALTSPAVRAALAERGVEPLGYGEL